MHNSLVRDILYPLHERIMGRPTFRLLEELERSQWLSTDQLRARQGAKLMHLLRHAALTCPFYTETLESLDVDPVSEGPFDVLGCLPLVDKRTVRERIHAPMGKPRDRRTRPMSTGGSTGETLDFYVDTMRTAYDKAARMRTHRWFGVEPGDKEVYLWAAPIGNRRQDRLRTVRDGLLNDLLLSAFDLSPVTTRRYLRAMRAFDPVCVFGSPSSLVKLCEFARRADLTPNLRSLKAVFVTGVVLDVQQRAALSEFFAVPVVDGYGGRDSGFCAHECAHGTMHVTSEHVVMEIVDSSGRPRPHGESGEIVVTNLDNFATPFIRYRTGDVGRMLDSTCPCGRGLEIMDVVAGRKTDHLVAADGSLRHALSVIYLLREMENVRQFQIHQKHNRSIDVRVVAHGKLDIAARDRVLSGVHRCLGENLGTTLHVVDEIAAQPSGKFRHVISDAVES